MSGPPCMWKTLIQTNMWSWLKETLFVVVVVQGDSWVVDINVGDDFLSLCDQKIYCYRWLYSQRLWCCVFVFISVNAVLWMARHTSWCLLYATRPWITLLLPLRGGWLKDIAGLSLALTLALFKTEWRGALRLRVGYSKKCFKSRSV
jgi:hypothetical protein